MKPKQPNRPTNSSKDDSYFDYIALSKEGNKWRIGTFDEFGMVTNRLCNSFAEAVEFARKAYGIKQHVELVKPSLVGLGG